MAKAPVLRKTELRRSIGGQISDVRSNRAYGITILMSVPLSVAVVTVPSDVPNDARVKRIAALTDTRVGAFRLAALLRDVLNQSGQLDSFKAGQPPG